MADTARELKLNERNFVRHAGKFLAQAAREHGVRLHDSDIDMMRRSVSEIVNQRSEQNEQRQAETYRHSHKPSE